MGVQTGKDLLNSNASALTLDELVTVLRHRADFRGAHHPTIMFDCNWLARKLGKGGNRDPIPFITMLAEAFVTRNVNIHLVCDGPTRHHSKKATFDRLRGSEQARVDTIFHRKHLMELVERSRRLDLSQEEVTETAKCIVDIQKTITSLEKKIKEEFVSSDFVASLKEASDDLCFSKGYGDKVYFCIARTQADSVIQYSATHDKIDGAVANDADFACVAGAKMLMVKDFKLVPGKRNQKATAECILIASSSFATIYSAVVDVLKKPESDAKKAKCDLWETDDPMIRALIAVGTGCDTLPGGVPDLGLSKINAFMKDQKAKQPRTKDDLLDFYEQASAKKNQPMKRNLFEAFALAMLYEPGNLMGDMNAPCFIHGPPASLPEYLQEFLDGTQIDVSFDVGRRDCVGMPNTAPHCFADGEPVFLMLVLSKECLSNMRCQS
jgi:hypothetical protein